MCIRDRFNDGYITYDELKNAEPVIVSYDAAVSDKAIDGDKVENLSLIHIWYKASQGLFRSGYKVLPSLPVVLRGSDPPHT